MAKAPPRFHFGPQTERKPWRTSTATATERGYGWEWQKLRKRILARDKHLCQPCLQEGRYHPANEVDHILSKAQGGTDDESNLQAIATECHRKKTALDSRSSGGGSL